MMLSLHESVQSIDSYPILILCTTLFLLTPAERYTRCAIIYIWYSARCLSFSFCMDLKFQQHRIQPQIQK